MTETEKCSACGEDEFDVEFCASCGGGFCDNCIDWCHDVNDESCGDYFCANCQAEESDSRGPAILVRGSVALGFTFVGPFPTIRDAIAWHDSDSLNKHLGIPATVALLVVPTKRG